MKPEEKALVRQFCELRGGILQNTVDDKTTHLVTGTIQSDAKNAIVCQRTMKCINAIAHGIFIVSIHAPYGLGAVLSFLGDVRRTTFAF